MNLTAYYNENNPDCAAWLRRLVAGGAIPAGDVDDRDIRDVRPDDVRGYAQCHWFAGIGIWALALEWAGWPDDRPIWTGSCPCQPFSGAGKGEGFADQRHLWPVWYRLIRECRPEHLVGEQVESRLGWVWLDALQVDLEDCNYACGAVALPVAGLGAPNLRHRIWWVADAHGDGCGAARADHGEPERAASQRGGADGGLADAEGERQPERVREGDRADPLGRTLGDQHGELAAGVDGRPGRLADADQQDLGGRGDHGPGQGAGAGQGRAQQRPPGFRATGGVADTEGGGCGKHGVLGEADRGGVDARQPALGDQAAGGRVGDAEPPGLSDPGAQELPRAGRWREGGEPEPSGRPADPWRELEWIDCRDGKRRPTQPGIFPLAARHPGDVSKLRAIGNAISPQVAAAVIKAWMSER